jgi:hypothetical protein
MSMNQMVKTQRGLRTGLGAGLFAGTLLFAPLAQAFCGFYAGKADASLFNEASQVIVARDGQRTVLSMLNDYKGPLSEFALVVPTPTVLKQGQVRVAEKLIFQRLDAYSSPRLAEYHDSNPCQLDFAWGLPMPHMMRAMSAGLPMATARGGAQTLQDKALGVTVEAQYTLEEYDIVSLSATQSDGLETWLHQNGYKIPAGASAALKPYINMGMKFFVAKVNLKEQLKTGYSHLRPLQFAFESEKFMLPMRLGMLNAPPDKAQDLIVYVLTKNGRVESSNYRTAKLPANVNLPAAIKPKFKDFYAALFDTATKKEDYKVVFTEYFWDMAWCDPCADNPLSRQELLQAGAFWTADDASDAFLKMQGAAAGSLASTAAARPARIAMPQQLMPMPMPRVILQPPMGGGAQPAVLTRLHVRYTAKSFAEDLMFIQTSDRQNWQTRYVVQNPYGGSVAQCQADAAKLDCAAQCKPRVTQLSGRPSYGANGQTGAPRAESELMSECQNACQVSKKNAVDAALSYYNRDLPQRLSAEKQTLSRLTGWGLADMEALVIPNANLGKPVETVSPTPARASERVLQAAPAWWQKLFSASQTD